MITRIFAATLLLVGMGVAQEPGRMMEHMGPGPEHMGPAPMIRTFSEHRFGPHEWWKNPMIVQKLGLTDAQVQKLTQIAYDNRLKMIDLRAALEREEVKLEPLMEAASPDENQVLAQIDKINAQRGQVEKAHVQMMLATRRVLTPEQWKKFQTSMPAMMMHHGPDGPDGEHNVIFFREKREVRTPGPGGEMRQAPAPAIPPQE